MELIHDIRYLCTRLRADGIYAMLRNFSGGKRPIKFSNAEKPSSSLFIVVHAKMRSIKKCPDL